MDPPDPIEAIKFRMEQKGLTRRDLEELIGTRTRIAEVLNRKRGLSIGVIRRIIAPPAAGSYMLSPGRVSEEHRMAIWKRLTGLDGGSVDVNLDQVAYIRHTGSVTTVYFAGGETDSGRAMSVGVKETPDEILRSATVQKVGFSP